MKRLIFILFFLILGTLWAQDYVINKDFYIVRGDSVDLQIVAKGNHAIRELSFGVKTSYNPTTLPLLINKRNTLAGGSGIVAVYDSVGKKTTITIRLDKAQTSDFTLQSYVYDITTTDHNNPAKYYTLAMGAIRVKFDVQTPFDGTNLVSSARRYMPVYEEGFNNNDYIRYVNGKFVGVQLSQLTSYSQHQIDSLLGLKQNSIGYTTAPADSLINPSLLWTKAQTQSYLNTNYRTAYAEDLINATKLNLADSLSKWVSRTQYLSGLAGKQNTLSYIPAPDDSVWHKRFIYTKNEIDNLLSGKQNTFTLKTINGNSLFGTGDITITGGGTVDTTLLATHNWVISHNFVTGTPWTGLGYITSSALTPYLLKTDSTLYSTQDDLRTGLAGKQNSLGYTAANIINVYTKSIVDSLLTLKASSSHNHSLSGLSEKSYNSLTDKPDLTSLHSHLNKAKLDSLTARAVDLNSITASLLSNISTAYSNNHTHSNKTTLDNTQESFTSALKTNYDAAYSALHSHTNKANLDSISAAASAINSLTSTKITNWNTAYTNNHTHANKAKLDSLSASAAALNTVTSSLITNWNTAYTNNHAHSNKAFLDSLAGTAAKLKAFAQLTNASGVLTNNGSGTFSYTAVGTSANNLVQLNSSGQLPAVSGALLTNLPSSGGYTVYRRTTNFTTTSASATTITGLSFSAGASKKYHIIVKGYIYNDHSSGSAVMSLSIPTNAKVDYVTTWLRNGITQTPVLIFNGSSLTNIITSSSQYEVKGLCDITLTTDSAGTVALQLLAQDYGTSTAYIGTQMLVAEVQ